MSHIGSGLYRMSDGALVQEGNNYCWPAAAPVTGTRAYQYYQNTVGSQIQFDKPSVEAVDGSERSLAALLAAGSASARNPATTGMIAASAVTERIRLTGSANYRFYTTFVDVDVKNTDRYDIILRRANTRLLLGESQYRVVLQWGWYVPGDNTSVELPPQYQRGKGNTQQYTSPGASSSNWRNVSDTTNVVTFDGPLPREDYVLQEGVHRLWFYTQFLPEALLPSDLSVNYDWTLEVLRSKR
mgnify:CR=1 FL=1